MLSERGRRALLGILENAEKAQLFTADLSFDQFANDERTLYAVTRCLEIVSEASRRVDDGTRERYPDIPWRQIASAGNIYRHRYDSVSPSVLWRTVQDRMTELIVLCRAELAETGSDR